MDLVVRWQNHCRLACVPAEIGWFRLEICGWGADAGSFKKGERTHRWWRRSGDGCHFSVEWKISPKGNSGIIFLLQEDKKYEHPWHTGPEMQVLDNEGHPDGKITSHRSGDLYDLIRSSSEPVKGPGEWNKAEIRFEKGKLDLYMNGVLVVSTMMGDENWKQLVAKSKFRRWPDFATFTSGRIALQDHGDPVWYRNIKIRKL